MLKLTGIKYLFPSIHKIKLINYFVEYFSDSNSNVLRQKQTVQTQICLFDSKFVSH